MADESAAGRPKWQGWLGVGAVATVVLLCSGVLTGGDDEPDEDALRWDAEKVCKDEFIAKRLKAPSTADYDLDVTGGPKRFTVSGTVDAENSFGAKLRNDVTCIVEDEGDRWRLISVALN